MEKEDIKIQYTFFGKIFSERAYFDIKEPLTFAFKDGSQLKTSIRVSQITAIYTTSKKADDVYTLKNNIEDFIRLEVDILGYLLGCGYDVEITGVVDSLSNETVIFGVNIGDIEKDKERLKLFPNILGLLNKYKERAIYLRICLGDFREAIRTPKDTGFFCYRAIESLRQFFFVEKNCKDERDSWETLRNELKIDRDKIDPIKNLLIL